MGRDTSKKTTSKTGKPSSSARATRRKTSKAEPKAPKVVSYPQNAEEALLAKLRESIHESMNVKQLLADADLKERLKDVSVLDLLKQLEKEEKVEDTGNNKFRAELKGEIFTGKLETARDGRAWVFVQELEQEVQLDTEEPIKAFHGDIVRIRVRDRKKGKLQAWLLDILKPAKTQFVGTIDRTARAYYMIPQEGRIKPDFIIHEDSLKGATHGQKVLVRIKSWKNRHPEAEVIQVLGEAGTHNTEMNAIVLEFGLDTFFPETSVSEAEAIPREIPAEEIKRRRDFRNITTFTIDPVDAKDFDDALSYRKLADGTVEVGVHIADVSHYLKPDTALDADAIHRATSVYLVDRTVPMLPERLSNDLCSLRPNEDRLCFAAVFKIDAEGNIIEEWFGRTAIHSNRRFTYEEVQEILEGAPGDYAEELLHLNQLAYILRKERFAQGSINFETEEVKFKLDENFKPVSVFKKVRKDAHKLVEDFMLLANRRVASYVAHFSKKPQVPYPYRIHDVPQPEKLEQLRGFVGSFGYKIETTDKKKIAKSINRLVTDVDGKPEQNLIQSVAIRAMPKAIYTTFNVGHYGLGFEYYAHFTSPIRRYPDVLAHRILQQVLDGKVLVDADELEELCAHCSERERRAAEAERASIKYKQVEFLSALIGQEFDGIISGVTDWGIYVELNDNKCEGMLSLRDMTDDHYELDERNYLLRGKRRGRTFRLGDKLRVEVKKTNLVKRIADFKLIEKL